MRSQNKRPDDTDRMVDVKRGEGQRSGDADSKLLEQIARNIGNNELNDQLNARASKRDELLAMICQRLQKAEAVQQIELREMSNEREWFRQVAKGAEGYTLPQPTRWHECAQLFQRAAQALAEGHLGRGEQLLELALEKERAAYNSLPRQVERHLEEEELSASANPLGRGFSDSAVCPATALPTEIRAAQRILNITAVMGEVPPLRLFRNWWMTSNDQEAAEEEDENAAKTVNRQTDAEQQEEQEQAQERDEELEHLQAATERSLEMLSELPGVSELPEEEP